MNNTLSVGGVFCDIQKAFRFINHDILLSNLQFYCTVGSVKALIMSYIKDRYQQVLINSSSPLWGKINTGVTQVSIHNCNPCVCIKFVYSYTVKCNMTNSISDRSVRPFNGLMEWNKNEGNIE